MSAREDLDTLRESIKASPVTYGDIARMAGNSVSWVGMILRGGYGPRLVSQAVERAIEHHGFKVPRSISCLPDPVPPETDGAIHHEVMSAGERLADGAEGVLETLLHEAAHGLAHMRKIQDTSREGRYHNKRFMALAEELGLRCFRRPKIGWSGTKLEDATREEYAAELERLDKSISGYRKLEGEAMIDLLAALKAGGDDEAAAALEPKVKPKPKRAVLMCECEPTRRISVAHGIAVLGPIICGVCKQDFKSPGVIGEGEEQ